MNYQYSFRSITLLLRKVVVVLLASSFVVSPFGALAQEGGTDPGASAGGGGEVATDSGAPTEAPPPEPEAPAPEFSIPGVEETAPGSEDMETGDAPAPGELIAPPAQTDEAAPESGEETGESEALLSEDEGEGTSLEVEGEGESLLSGGDVAPSAPNTQIFTSQNSAPKTDVTTGALTQTIPLDIPPGRNGLQPTLALRYNNQTAEDSIVGYGWTPSIPYVERRNKFGSEALYNTPNFSSSLDGELATTTTGTTTAYRARVDDGSFNTYSFVNNVWTMFDKNGVRYTFGASDNAQQNASASSTQIYRWMLQEIRDTNNNYVRYTYAKENGQIYPVRILYTGNAGTDGPFTVIFSTTTRSDAYTDYRPGFKVTTSYKINKITASVSGTVVREYNLSYTTGNNGSRSLLSAVQVNAWDDNHANQVTYPSLTLGYINSGSSFVAKSSAVDWVKQSTVIGDANGDGVNDVTIVYRTDSSSPIVGFVYHGGAGTETYFSPAPPSFWARPAIASCMSYPSVETATRYVDVNADGKADMPQNGWDYSQSANVNALTMNTYSTSTGYGWADAASSTWNGEIPQFTIGSVGVGPYTTGFLGDVNGDGLPDYVKRLDGSGVTTGTNIGNGTAWNLATTTIFSAPFSMPYTTPTVTNSQLVDINADGLLDWLYSDTTSTYVRLNNGTGWDGSPSSQWTISTSTLYSDGGGGFLDRGMRFIDMNGDNLPDFVRAFQNTSGSGEIADYKLVLLNTGNGWATSTAYSLSYITTGPGVSGPQCINEYANWTGNGQNAQDVLSTVTYPQGGTETISYVKTAQSGNGELPYSLLVVSSIVSNDGLGTSATKTYTFSGGKQYVAQGVRERKFAGFETSTETDANAITTTYFNQGDTINTSLGVQNDGYAQIGRPYRVDVKRLSDSSLLRQTFTKWDSATSTLASTTVFVSKAREVMQDYDAVGSTHRDTASEFAYSTTTGNVTSITRYGEVTGNSNGTFSDMGTDKSTQTLLYAVSTTTQSKGLVYNDTVVDQSSNKVRESRRTYDGLALGSVSKGNETKTENWITSATYASTTKTYDGTYGLVTQTRDPKANVTTYTLDSRNLYVATSTNPLSQTKGYQYEYSTGKVKAIFDENSRLNTTVYDGLGRPLTVSIPDPSTGVTVTKTTFAYTDSTTPGATSVTQTDFLNSGTSSVSYLYFDGLNRKLQSRKTAESSNYVVKDWTYNNVGLLGSETLPYFGGGASRTTKASSSTLYTTYTYDALQRVTNSTNAVGSTLNEYQTWVVKSTDPNGKTKDYIKDAHGNLTTVVERISTTTGTTTYTWDLNKNLTKITDALGNVRNFTYDGLGRRLTAQDLHGTSDGSFAVATSTYDVGGNLTQTLDAKSQTVNFTYDALNRVLTEDYTGAAGTEVQYAYDTCTDGKGRLCAATTTDAVTNLTYSPNGLVASERRTVDNTSYTTSYLYDRQGNITDLTYPSGAIVKYGYDNVGLLDTISRKAPGGSNFVKAVLEIQYAPTGAVSYQQFGNGVRSYHKYDPSKLYRMDGLESFASSTWIGGGGGGTGQLGAARNAVSNFAAANEIGTKLEFASAELPRSGAQILKRVKPQLLAVAGVGDEGSALLASSPSSLTPISDMIVEKSAKDRATIKGQEIANIGNLARATHGDYDIQIESMTPIEGGVAVFARAWDKNRQIGFDLDGSVDIERFLIYNPPILVADPAGAVVRVSKNPETGEDTVKRYREDPQEALLQTLAHTISVKQQKFGPESIVSGKIGNTTSIFFPDANPESSSVDGVVYHNAGPSGLDWSSLRGSAGTDANDTSTNEWTVFAASANTANNYTQLVRGVFLFDTSPLGEIEGIWSATVSLWGLESISTGGFMSDATVGVYSVNPASNTALAPSDYATFGTTPYSNVTRGLETTWNEAGYNDFSLNAAGLSAISRTGATKIGQREATHDVTGVAPTWPGGIQSVHFGTQTADFAGTTNDPKLVIEHSGYYAGPQDTVLQKLNYVYDANGNITQIYETAGSGAGRTVLYTYDDVNRLTSASTTAASSTSFKQTYSYNNLGNITGWKTDAGATTTYAYAGTSNANPHAPTSIAGGSIGYDLNGNVTSGSGGKFYSWDYRNRITVAGNGTATSTYGYDHQNQRVRKVFGSATTTYPNKYMSKAVSATNSQGTSTDYIYMGDTIIAEVEVAPASGGGGGEGMSMGESMQSAMVSETQPGQVSIDGKPTSIATTDDNSDEDLLISSDRQTYDGISQADVYFTVENTTQSVQHVDLALYFPNGTEGVSSIVRLQAEEVTYPTFASTCTPVKIASTTPKLEGCTPAITGTQTTTLVGNKKTALATAAFSEASIASKLATGSHARKSVGGNVSDQTAQDVLEPGEKGYYVATIHFDRGSSGKFFIEAVGDHGGYGHLDPWYSSSWQYRKKITLSGSSGAGTNYQVLLRIGESSGSTSTKQFDLGGHSANFPSGQGQGGDFRFTAADGTTELKFWVEEATSTAPNRIAYVWVKVGEDLGTTKDIYIYYGYAGASNASDGFNTFTFFDNFDDGVINAQKWTTICASGCNITAGVSTSITESGGVIKQFDAAVADSRSRVVGTSTPVDTSGYATKRRFRRTDNGTFANSDTGFGSNITSHTDPGTSTPKIQNTNFDNVVKLWNASSSSQVSTTIYNADLTQNVWYREESQRKTSTMTGGALWSDAQYVMGTASTTLSTAITQTEYPYLRSGDGHDVETDWVLLRKYKNPEPAFSSAATEEVFSATSTSMATTTRYFLPDHLNSTNVITNASGTALQVLDYYPYGSTRINQTTNGFNEQKQFIAQVTDPETNLSYLMARYYDGSRGQFLSEDPVFLAVGNRHRLKELTQQEQQQLLADPQQLNSYSYARGNPTVNKDPAGLLSAKAVFGGLDYISNMLFFGQTVPNYVVKSPGETAQQSANDSAQFYLDGSMFAAGQYVGYLSPPGVALNVGGLSLYGIDTYCATKQCSNFEGAQYIPAGAILDSIPKRNLGVSGNKSSFQTLNTSFGGSTMQQRQATVNSFNTTAHSNQEKLWVTPSGAVVTWQGELKAGPLSSPAK